MLSLLTAAMDASASPRKPSVRRASRSFSVAILLVAWGRAQFARSSFVMPQPLSATRIFSMPPPVISTLMLLAPLSTALSISSRTMAHGRSMTSPAAIFRATSGGSVRTAFWCCSCMLAFLCQALRVPFSSMPLLKRSSTGSSGCAGVFRVFFAGALVSFSSS